MTRGQPHTVFLATFGSFGEKPEKKVLGARDIYFDPRLVARAGESSEQQRL